MPYTSQTRVDIESNSIGQELAWPDLWKSLDTETPFERTHDLTLFICAHNARLCNFEDFTLDGTVLGRHLVGFEITSIGYLAELLVVTRGKLKRVVSQVTLRRLCIPDCTDKTLVVPRACLQLEESRVNVVGLEGAWHCDHRLNDKLVVERIKGYSFERAC